MGPHWGASVVDPTGVWRRVLPNLAGERLALGLALILSPEHVRPSEDLKQEIEHRTNVAKLLLKEVSGLHQVYRHGNLRGMGFRAHYQNMGNEHGEELSRRIVLERQTCKKNIAWLLLPNMRPQVSIRIQIHAG